jgi:Tfp pilus assembly protein PilF
MKAVGSMIALLVLATAALAQQPDRPKLEARADTNDWEAYYDFGLHHLQRFPNRSYAAFYWASRLAPWSADPLYAQWVAFHLRDVPRFARYLDDDAKILDRPDVQAADSVVRMAFLRNPFVHRALEMALYDALPGSWRGDVMTRAWLAYAGQKLDRASELFGQAVGKDPERFYRMRHIRAVLFVAHKEYDSALTEMTALLTHARSLDEKKLVREYESKAFYEYAIGRLEIARGQLQAAREAFERALIEDLTYAPAHAGLAMVAEMSRDREGALASYRQAIEISPLDAIYRYQYGIALINASRFDEALEQINRAIELEPHYADPYVFKASAHEHLSQADSARLAYRMYLVRAPLNATQNRSLAARRLAALEAPAAKP